MKKYLMMGFAAIALASCSSHDTEVYQPKSQEQKYQDAFEAAFGKVAADQDWGFTEQKTYRVDDNGNLIVDTRAAFPNGNQWATYTNVPDVLTDAQLKVVREWFQSHRNPQGIAVNWSDFFVQQVYKGGTNPTADCPETYTAKNGDKVVGGSHMDFLTAGVNDDHINNFNNGEGSVNGNVAYATGANYPADQNDLLYHADRIQLMQRTSSECYGYFSSTDSKQHDDMYVIIPGDEIDPIVAGMYFVGFDFVAQGTNPNQQVDADGYYSDWIVRIAPGDYTIGTRVFVEDLIAKEISPDFSNISGSDWDFNDAVYDVWYETIYENGGVRTEAVITLRAAGGTLPLYVGGKEVHAMMGYPSDYIINTGAVEGSTLKNVEGVPVAIYRIAVGNEDNAANIPTYAISDEGTVQLEAKTGKATQKFAIPVTAKWVKETVNFSKAYPTFKNWCSDPTVQWWNNGVAEYLY